MRYGRSETHHIFSLRHIIQAFRSDQQRTGVTINQRIDQQRLQLITTQIVQYFSNTETQERFVLQRLNRPFLNRREELINGFLVERQLQQAAIALLRYG